MRYISPLTQKAEVFFVEKLENGAGYCNYLSGRRYPNIPKEAIIRPLIKGGNIYEQLVSDDHRHGCTSSCYDCIRDYSNQQVHSLLNWRLGLDLARLANDSNATIDFTVNYWEDYIFNVVKNTLVKQGYENVKEEGNTLVGVDPFGERFCLVHPLWSKNYVNKLLKELGGIQKVLSAFDITKFN